MGLEMDRMRRLFVGAVMPALLVGLTAIPWLVLHGDVPSPLAIHFNGSGEADGSMPAGALLLVIALFTIPASGALVWAAWRSAAGVSFGAGFATFMGAIPAALNLVLLRANRGAGRWQDVTLPPAYAGGIVIGSLVAALVVARMVPARDHREEGARTSPALDLEGTDRVAWFGGARSVPFSVGSVTLVGIGTVVLLAFSGSGAAAVTGFSLIAVSLAMTSFMSVHVAVGEQGIRVRSGSLPWPSVRFELAEVEAAAPIDLDPMSSNGLWTGWGYRGSLLLFGKALWVVRKGPALELDLADGRRFTVTVDDAPEAAAVVNGLLARRDRA